MNNDNIIKNVTEIVISAIDTGKPAKIYSCISPSKYFNETTAMDLKHWSDNPKLIMLHDIHVFFIRKFFIKK